MRVLTSAVLAFIFAYATFCLFGCFPMRSEQYIECSSNGDLARGWVKYIRVKPNPIAKTESAWCTNLEPGFNFYPLASDDSSLLNKATQPIEGAAKAVIVP